MVPGHFPLAEASTSLERILAGPIGPTHYTRLANPTGSGSDRQMKHWIRWLPGLETLRRYEAAWLPHLKIPLILNEAVNIDEEGLLPHEFYELLHERPQSRLRHSWHQVVVQAALPE